MDERSLVRDWRSKSYPWQAISNMTRRAVVDLRRDYDAAFVPPSPMKPVEPTRPFVSRMEAIASRVALAYECTLHDLRCPTRGLRNTAHARSAAYEACMAEGFTSTQVAHYFGRDHSTVVQGRKSHQRRERDAEKRRAA